MWERFFIACALGAVFLVCPGFLFARIFRLPYGKALCAAPLFSSAIFSILSIVYEELGILASPISVVVIPALALTSLAAVSRLVSKGEKHSGDDIPLQTIALYVFAGISVGLLVFVKQLDGPFSILQSWDEIHHLNGTQAFAESGVFSFFHGAVYTSDEAALAPNGTGSFYPAGWQVICALLAQVVHSHAALAINATNYLFSSFVFPLGMALFLSILFEGDERLIRTGAIVATSFVAFPWLLTLWGPIYPNLAAYCVIPAACSLFLDGFAADRIFSAIRLAILFLLGIAGIALLHPNGVFVIAVMLGSFLVHEALVGRLQNKIGFNSGSYRRDALILTAIFAVLWFIVNRLPFMLNVTDFVWQKYQTPSQAVVDFVTLGYVDGFFGASSPQLLLAFFLVFGIVDSVKSDKNAWLIMSYAFWGFALILSTSTEGIIKQLVAGFWYTDHCRLASAAALCAIPFATVGAQAFFDLAAEKVVSFIPMLGSRMSSVCVLVLYISLIFFPNCRIPGFLDTDTSFGRLCSMIESEYRIGAGMLDEEEWVFLEEVAEIVPEGAIVANNPLDGSVFAFGAYDIHVLYRSVSGYDDSELESSALVRNNIDEYIDDDTVRASVDELGVEYVLLLNIDSSDSGYINYIMGDGTEFWPGLYDIDENTPGFTLILEDGDMRLYMLDDAA